MACCISHLDQTLQKEREVKLKLDAMYAESQRENQVLTVDLKDARQKLERLEADHETVLAQVPYYACWRWYRDGTVCRDYSCCGIWFAVTGICHGEDYRSCWWWLMLWLLKLTSGFPCGG